MICIFSASRDSSTTEVMQWLHQLGHRDVLRVNYDEADDNNRVFFDVGQKDIRFRVGDRTFRLQDLTAVWYRKGRDWLLRGFPAISLNGRPKLAECLTNKLKAERSKFAEYVHWLIEQSIPCLGSATKMELNKLVVLQVANELGLRIPQSYVVDSRVDLLKLFQPNQEYITKAASDGIYLFDYDDSRVGYFTYTETIDPSAATNLPDRYFPSLVQRQIDKLCDIRVFHLAGMFYAMAIFSQADEKTKVDFRKYNHAKPNRTVPLTLPDDLIQKLKDLFSRLGLNTGSVDLILDNNGDFHFLEVNPVGQFSMVSKPCNYFLEKQIAITLIEYSRNKK